jgi:hypothetical protein
LPLHQFSPYRVAMHVTQLGLGCHDVIVLPTLS